MLNTKERIWKTRDLRTTERLHFYSLATLATGAITNKLHKNIKIFQIDPLLYRIFLFFFLTGSLSAAEWTESLPCNDR